MRARALASLAAAAGRRGAHAGAAPTPILVDPAARLGVALVTLNRPASLNALSSGVAREVVAALRAAAGDARVRAVVLAGAGRAFAAGADVKELAEFDYDKVCAERAGEDRDSGPDSEAPTPTPPPPLQARSSRLLASWDALASPASTPPLIAAVDGPALGGGFEVCQMADLVVAGASSTFAQPELRLGVPPGMGATQRLTRALGRQRALDLILTGRTLTASEAEALGLVARVVPAGTAVDAALDLASRVAAAPPGAVAAARRAVAAALDTPLSAGLEAEHAEFWGCFGSGEQREGMAAFLGKREPVWGA